MLTHNNNLCSDNGAEYTYIFDSQNLKQKKVIIL